MPGQPDWQRYQSSMGQPLYQASVTVSPTVTAWLPVGPWRAFLAFFTPVGTGVWTVDEDFASDAAGVNPTGSRQIVIGETVPYKAWRPMLGTYVRFTSTLRVAGGGDQLSVFVLPTLMESMAGARGIPDPMIHIYEALLNHNNFVDRLPDYVAGGPAMVEVRANVNKITYDLFVMANNGVYSAVRRWQAPVANAAVQFPIVMPDQQFKVRVSNVEGFAQATYDLTVSPL